MALDEYHRKRDFGKTPEPSGSRRRASGRGRRCRLSSRSTRRAGCITISASNSNGVLLSWAIPKGPSLDPGEKRLAVACRGPSDRIWRVRGRHPEGPVRRRHGAAVGPRHLGAARRPTRKPPTRRARSNSALDGDEAARQLGAGADGRQGGARSGHENWLLIKERDEEAMPGSGSAARRRQPAQRRDRPHDGCDRRRSRPRLGFARARSPARNRRQPSRRRRSRAARVSAAPARRQCRRADRAAACHRRADRARGRRVAARDQIRRLSPARAGRATATCG